MKVYIIYQGRYSDRVVLGIHTDKKSAENWAFNRLDGNEDDTEVEEYELVEEKIARAVPKWRIYLTRDGKVRDLFNCGDCKPRRVPTSEKDYAAIWNDFHSTFTPYLSVVIAGETFGASVEKAKEINARMIESGEWDRLAEEAHQEWRNLNLRYAEYEDKIAAMMKEGSKVP